MCVTIVASSTAYSSFAMPKRLPNVRGVFGIITKPTVEHDSRDFDRCGVFAVNKHATVKRKWIQYS